MKDRLIRYSMQIAMLGQLLSLALITEKEFTNVNHEWMIKFLEHDIEDKNFIRYIKRFLRSGIMEEGKFIESDKGTPQGGLISPILANVYLHYVLDLWFEKIIKKECYYASMVRYGSMSILWTKI